MYAPILISVYDRQCHLEKCIESLKLNSLSDQTEVYIVSDAAHSKKYEPDIELIRKYISTITGFKNVIPINREKNLGSFLSINSAIEEIGRAHV